MFEADIDNLKEELNYIDNIISYNIYHDIYSCQQSEYDIIQENNDNNLRSKIKESRDDEVNHKNTGMKEGKNKFKGSSWNVGIKIDF